MKIELQQVGKRFNRQWLFKNISYQFLENKSYAIIGNNGSGKSTLLQMIYGFQTISQGKIIIQNEGIKIPDDQIHQHSSYVAPYLELLEEFTLVEMLHFHFQFKERLRTISIDEMIVLCKLEDSRNKQVKLFSSGMKQRLKLALAFFSNSPLVFLDEPCSNLDMQGIDWYQEMIASIVGKCTLIVASNQSYEFDFCDGKLKVEEFK